MANRFSNTKHVHFTHSNSKFCLNSYESDIPCSHWLYYRGTQKHTRHYWWDSLVFTLFMLLKLLVSANLSLSTFPFPLFLSSILAVFFLGPLSDIWCAHHFLPSGLLKVSGVHGNTGSYTASSREACGVAFAPLIHGLKNWTSYVEDRTCMWTWF